MTDQELIEELHTFAGKPVDYAELVGSPVPSSYGISFVYEDPESYCMVAAAERIAAKNATITALQTENAEKDKEIERLKKCRHECKIDCLLEEYNRVCAALSRVEAERDKAMKALEDMRFAYINKDADCPHQFESEALACAERLLEQWRGVQGGWSERC